MNDARRKVWQIAQPRRLFFLVLTLIFAVEAVVMLVLPQWLPARGVLLQSAVDACLLTAVLAPLLWRLVIVPLRELVTIRTELLERVLTAQEEERGRIARDLHDGLGQLLTSLLVGLRAVEESSPDDQARQQLRDLRRIGGDAHEEIRRLASGLRPSVLDDVGLVAALERYFEDVGRFHAVCATVELDGLDQSRLPREVETALYRFVQEATTNSIRHGAADEIRLVVRHSSNCVEMEIRDNGCGFDPQTVLGRRSRTGSLDLWSIRERIALLSGTVKIESKPGAGALVAVRIPLESVSHMTKLQ